MSEKILEITIFISDKDKIKSINYSGGFRLDYVRAALFAAIKGIDENKQKYKDQDILDEAEEILKGEDNGQ